MVSFFVCMFVIMCVVCVCVGVCCFVSFASVVVALPFFFAKQGSIDFIDQILDH